jgi:hypothetical protein
MVAEMANDDTVDADRIMEVIASGSGHNRAEPNGAEPNGAELTGSEPNGAELTGSERKGSAA